MRPELSQFDTPVAAYDEQFGPDRDQAPKRPTAIRRETDWILSYYQQAGTESEANDDEPPHDETQWARASTPGTTSSDSNSAYSSDGDEPPSSSSPTRLKSNERGRGRGEEDLASSSFQAHHRREGGERRNAGRRPSELSADRRRIAVIELDPVPLSIRRGKRPDIANTTTPSPDQPRRNTRLAEKSGIALIAPSDASPAAYTNLTPPSSAPAHISTTPNSITPPNQDPSKHKRSVSDVVGSPHRSPRDVGIVGQVNDTNPSFTRNASNEIQSYFDIQGSKVPVFQTPHRSPMPSPIPESVTASSQYPDQLTPGVGEAKDIHRPVAGPVVVDVDGAVRDRSGPLLTPSFSPSVPSSYLHYQPGVHSIAGPPPPLINRPGRSDNAGLVSPPPRPPRMHTPAISSSSSNSDLEHAKEQTFSTTAPKAPQLSPTTSGESLPPHDRDTSQDTVKLMSAATDDIAPDSPPLTKPLHTREGAFPPSTRASLSPTLPPELSLESSVSSILSSSPSDESIPPPTPHKDDPLPVSVLPPSPLPAPTSRSNPPHPPRSRPVSVHKSTDLPEVPSNSSGSAPINERSPPSPPAGALNGKRFTSLPRAPSVMSGSNFSCGSPRTSSPKRRKKIVEQWPVAMQHKDVLECKTPLERSLGYARKINELAMYDCGLTSWMDVVNARAIPRKLPGHTRSKPSVNIARYTPSSHHQSPEERKVSRDSFESGTTFPMRPDAYTATDLSTRARDLPVRAEDLMTKAPSLPYPSLAPMTRSTTQNSTVTSPPSSMRSLPITLQLSGSKSTGGFFSSLGRKASLKKDKQPPSPGKPLVNKTIATPPQQKPIHLPRDSTPHIIGGPRAIPGRSHSIVAQPVARPEETQKQASHKRRSTVSGKRPSLFPPPSNKSMPPPPNPHHASMPPSSHKQGQAPGQIVLSDAQFNVQLDKLVHLLPRADRSVLAGYLRRSGQDILAVGKYLEDEKNGTIMYH